MRIIYPDYWKTSCDPTKAIAVQENVTYTGLNFGVEQIPGKVDLTGHLTDYNGWVLQSGQKDRIKLCVYNKGTAEAQNVEVVLNVDDRISGASFEPVPDQFDGKKAVWRISSIPAGSVLCFEMTSDIPGISNEDLVFSYEINADGTDENGSDNTGTTYFDLTNEGIEPISKATGNDREISLTEEFLLYKIRIHNISNSTIDRIVIRDTFDENIYLNKVWVNYSFEDQAVINIDYKEVEGNYQYIYTWTFDDAALVDSATDPLSSIGYLDVKIGLVPKMHPKGTEICNTAIVVAGNSEPVRTNTVCGSFGKVNIDETDPSLLQIRPNPANSSVLLSNPHNEKVNVIILSTDGRVEMQLQILPLSSTEISVDHLSNGVYFIHAEGYGSARFIKISN